VISVVADRPTAADEPRVRTASSRVSECVTDC
jgi:hypothetical protein